MKQQNSYSYIALSRTGGGHLVPERVRSIKTAQCWRGWFYLLLSGIYILFGMPAGGQALDTVHALPDETVRTSGRTVSVLLMPGEFEPDQWYYTTSNLHFGMRELSGKQVPEMTLLRYQRPDPNNPNKYIEGATLQLAVDIDPLDDAAKRNLRRIAETAAKKWESAYYQDFTTKLKAAAGTSTPLQEQWKTLYEDYQEAYKNFPNSRKTPTIDDLIQRALKDGLDSWAVEGLEESIRLLKMRGPVSVSALPTSSAQLTLFDGSGQASKTVGLTRGAAPEYATDKLTFTVELDRNVCSSFVIKETVSISGARRWFARPMRNSYSKSEKTRKPRTITWAPILWQNSTVSPLKPLTEIWGSLMNACSTSSILISGGKSSDFKGRSYTAMTISSKR